MKLDFAKAYDTISWDCVFQAMKAIGLHPEVHWDNQTFV